MCEANKTERLKENRIYRRKSGSICSIIYTACHNWVECHQSHIKCLLKFWLFIISRPSYKSVSHPCDSDLSVSLFLNLHLIFTAGCDNAIFIPSISILCTCHRWLFIGSFEMFCWWSFSVVVVVYLNVKCKFIDQTQNMCICVCDRVCCIRAHFTCFPFKCYLELKIY